MLSRWTRETKSTKRTSCLAVPGVLGLFGSGAYAVDAQDMPASRPRVSTPSITARPAERTSGTSARFAYRDSWWPGGRSQCASDGSRFRSCASPTRRRGPSGWGSHSFRVRVLGSPRRRVLSPPASYMRVFDPQPPTPEIARPATNSTISTSATVAFTDDEPNVGFQCGAGDTGAWRACASPFSYRRLSVGSTSPACARSTRSRRQVPFRDSTGVWSRNRVARAFRSAPPRSITGCSTQALRRKRFGSRPATPMTTRSS